MGGRNGWIKGRSLGLGLGGGGYWRGVVVVGIGEVGVIEVVVGIEVGIGEVMLGVGTGIVVGVIEVVIAGEGGRLHGRHVGVIE